MEEKKNEVDCQHYKDAICDVRYVDDFYFWVFVKYNGETKTLSVDSNFFNEGEMLIAYDSLWEGEYNFTTPEDKAKMYADFEKWLLDTGARPDVLAAAKENL